MSTTSNLETLTLPLTTIFTPPASCSTAFTYEGSYYNSIPGGLLIADGSATGCYPSGYIETGRIPATQIYSPGWCPSGWATPVVSTGGGTTSAVCCESGYSYYTTYSIINFFSSLGSQLFAGCVSTYTGDVATTLEARSGDYGLSMTSVSGLIMMWVYPVTIQYEQSDVSLFVTSPSSPSSVTASTTSTTTFATLSASPSPLISANPSQTTLPVVAGSQIASNSSLSTGSVAGIAVGATVAGILLLVGAIFVLCRRRRWRGRGTMARPDSYVGIEQKPLPVQLENQVPIYTQATELPSSVPDFSELDGGRAGGSRNELEA